MGHAIMRAPPFFVERAYCNGGPNFGFNLPWWDRLFGTYRDQPAAGHEGMTIGIDQFRDPSEQRLDHMLTQPFREADRGYSINRDRDAQ